MCGGCRRRTNVLAVRFRTDSSGWTKPSMPACVSRALISGGNSITRQCYESTVCYDVQCSRRAAFDLVSQV